MIHDSLNYTKEQFLKIPQLFDTAFIFKNKSCFEGKITCITERGITIKNNDQSKFYRWCHVKQILKM